MTQLEVTCNAKFALALVRLVSRNYKPAYQKNAVAPQLFGVNVAEGRWEPVLGPEDLFETISQALLAVDRDAYSGRGHRIHNRKSSRAH